MPCACNTEYNLSVVAVTPCGNAIASVTLNYGEAKLVVMQSCQLYYTHMNVDVIIYFVQLTVVIQICYQPLVMILR